MKPSKHRLIEGYLSGASQLRYFSSAGGELRPSTATSITAESELLFMYDDWSASRFLDLNQK